MTLGSKSAPGKTGRAASGAARPPRAWRGRKARRRVVILLMLAPALLGLGVFFVYPLLASLYYSFTSYDLFDAPRWIGFRNYVFLFTQDPLVGQSALNTLWFVVVLVPVRIVTAFAIAGLLARAKRASGFWRTLFYLPALISPVASVVAFVFLFNPATGPVNLILKSVGIAGPLWFNDPALSKPSLLILGVWMTGDVMVIALASLLAVPTDQYEAASLDGANGLQKVRYVTLPSIAPVLLFSVVTGVIAALQYFTEAAVAASVASGRASAGQSGSEILGYPEGSLMTYSQLIYVRGFGNLQLGYASALAVVMFVVAGVIMVLLLRRTKAFTPERIQ